MIDFFSGYSRFIKQSLTKESVAEKPYLEGEYPQMHLNLPEFKKPKWTPPKISAFPESAGLLRTHTIKYLKPSCALDTWNMEEEYKPGDIIHFEGDFDIPASAPRSQGTMIRWELSCSSKFVLLRMIKDDSRNYGQKPTFEAEILESITDSSIIVCAKAFVSGIVSSRTWSTIGGLPISMQYKGGLSPFILVSAGDQPVWLSGRTYAATNYNCGCFEVDILLAIFEWDSENSILVLGISDSGTVYVLGGEGPYNWALTHEYGQGFSFDIVGGIPILEEETEIKENIVSTDITAYGRTLITVTDAKAVEVTGRVHGNWREDWEGALVTTNHNWTELVSDGGCSVATPDADIYAFGGENVFKLESILVAGVDSYCNCQPRVDLNVSPEIPLNLGRYSGFTCQAYIAEFLPQTYTSANCTTNCAVDHEWILDVDVHLRFYWRPVGNSAEYTDYENYGIDMSARCLYGDPCTYTSPHYADTESFATFLARIGSWSNLPYAGGTDPPPPWGDAGYELTRIQFNISITALEDAIAVHGNTNMKVYFSDLILTPV